MKTTLCLCLLLASHALSSSAFAASTSAPMDLAQHEQASQKPINALSDIPPVAWYDQNGQQVSKNRIERITAECQIDEAAYSVANATSESFKAAFQDLLDAAACFEQYNFVSKPLAQ